jgi:type III secretory pathway component EscU
MIGKAQDKPQPVRAAIAILVVLLLGSLTMAALAILVIVAAGGTLAMVLVLMAIAAVEAVGRSADDENP